MTNKQKSLTLQEFEELAEAFVQGQRKLTEEFYSSPATLSEHYLEEFKAFAFKEKLKKDQRHKDFLKLKEGYFKLKDEFEPESNKEVEDTGISEPSLCIQIGKDYYKPAKETNDCEGCSFKGKEDCSASWDIYDCSDNRIIWVKKEVK